MPKKSTLNKKTLPNPAEMISDECIAVRLRMITRAVTRIYNAFLRPHGLTVSQMNILTAVSRFGPMRQQEVCQALCIEKSTLSRDAEKMRANGWLESAPGDDARSINLKTTAAGNRLLSNAFPAWRQAQEKALELLGHEDSAVFGKIAESLRKSSSG